ncbi:GNAT family N-acetyltransferase [Bordetella sp. N]|uniref:GNAT family N-acetyltransferase n=1 Tax=Bordetella sp. N TaxID=1746199 RepID=UPI0007096F96|nr:GNAT family N-acetyltransferase [Bordetella sp. N]ALM86170.1 hypothetical protein ASB57_27335 [Bordetella sp. N]
MPIGPDSIVIRQLTAEDAPAFQALRLAALEACPTAFGASVEDERALAISAVARRIAPADHGNAGGVGAFDGAELAGMACVFRAAGRKEAHKAHLVSVYVAPPWRGLGVSTQLVTAAISMAQAMTGVRRINLTVNVANKPALALYRRLGFVIYGEEPEGLCVNGEYQNEYLMSLALA